MKHLLSFFLFFIPVSMVSIQAQNASFFIGATGGGNLSKFKFTEDLSELYSTSNSVVGPNGGFLFGVELGKFTLSSGVQYLQKGGEYQTANFEDSEGVGFFSAKEKLHFISIPILVGYRKYFGDHLGLGLAIGPSINIGVGGTINERTEYFGSEDVKIENYKVKFGEGVNEDYRSTQAGFQISPSIIIPLNYKSKLTFNVTWDIGLNDSFNPRYKDANEFFDDYKGLQKHRSTIFSVGYEYHFPFGDKY